LRTVIETARKQGWRILDALASDSASLTARLVLA